MVATSEPQYPRLALCGSLPALVAHLSEHKLCAAGRIQYVTIDYDSACDILPLDIDRFLHVVGWEFNRPRCCTIPIECL